MPSPHSSQIDPPQAPQRTKEENEQIKLWNDLVLLYLETADAPTWRPLLIEEISYLALGRDPERVARRLMNCNPALALKELAERNPDLNLIDLKDPDEMSEREKYLIAIVLVGILAD